ncbi:uncharacterized protein LTR77_003416 [Saxophila tyrrhenica]|uniref:N-acetyltransferase domain-containing protein n=1 Tax=Saxophila tyrrhenica TaxID=1690608 RepID=A0AAV9PDL9_9PEZI|nr:hypothetical protein LTR77_003416 [Saxophila tyrrhenica]
MSQNQPNPFHSSRLIYRALESTDEPFIHTLESEPQGFINSQLALKKPQSTRETKKHFEHYTEKCILGCAICLPGEGENDAPKPIGVICLEPLEPENAHHRHTDMGLGLLPDYQGKGYGSEAIEWALQWAFLDAGLHRVGIKAFQYNTGARKLYEKLGFKLEGTAREIWWHAGRWWDDVQFGMLEKEWRERREGRVE